MAVPEEKIYEQQCAEFRALNTIFWQVPVIMMTLNGGLWFALGSLQLTDWGQRCLLWFAAIVDVLFIVALVRLRFLMGDLRLRIEVVEGASKAPMRWYTVISFGIILGLAAAGAIGVSWNPSGVLAKKPMSAASPPVQVEVHVVVDPPFGKSKPLHR